MIIEDLEDLDGYRRLSSFLIKRCKSRGGDFRILSNKNKYYNPVYSVIFVLFISLYALPFYILIELINSII
jgi:hypothetical protein